MGSLLEGGVADFRKHRSGQVSRLACHSIIYVKKAHIGVIPGLKEFIAEYVSDKALGPEGYLADKGLIPPSKAEFGKIRSGALALNNLRL